jgi:hypothetical protein
MNSSTMDLRFGVTLGLALFAACTEEGSLGEYPESSGTAVDDGATDDGATDDGATESGPTEGSGTADGSPSDSVSETTEGSSDATSETGNPEACMQPGNCSEFSPCDGANLCGTLDSLFDENGCVRTECQDDEACADDERCYRAMDFGGCAPSGVFCEDDPELQTCLCGSNPDCGGGFCVPEDLYPAASPLPGGPAFVAGTCAPDDGPAVYFQWGGFGVCDLDEAVLSLVFVGAIGLGTHDFDSAPGSSGAYVTSDLVEVEVLAATIEILAVDEDAMIMTGTVEVTVAPNDDGVQVLSGEFELPICEQSSPCG